MKTLFSGEKAFAHLRVLAEEIGPRHGGSRNEARAARHIRDHFRSLGLRSRLEPYPIYSFEDAKGSLTTPDGEDIPCIAVPISAATPRKGITREAIFIEEASPLLLDERVRDKIVVTFGDFGGGERAFISHGPAGLVSIQANARKRHFRGTRKADSKRKIGSVPTVRMTFEDGTKLIENLPARLTMKVATLEEKVGKGLNVVADLPGGRSGPPTSRRGLPGDSDKGEVIVVCAHYDSVWAGPGAFDNGGGTAGIMELARVYTEKGCRRNLRFVAFGGEEMGLWGARGYVRKLKDENDRIKKDKDFELDGLRTEFDRLRFVVNLDMMGPLHGRSSAIALGSADIAASARLLAQELRYPLNVRENEIYSSDNMAFNCVGIPSISFNRCGHGDLGGHTDRDVIDNCSSEGLAHVCRFIEKWMDRYVSDMHTFPFPKELPEAARTVVEKRFKGKKFLDYKVVAPKKRYRKRKNRRKEA